MNLSQRWSRKLTHAQRLAWSNYAQATPTPLRNRTAILSGSAQYYRSNRPRILGGIDPVDDGPSTPGIPPSPTATGTVWSNSLEAEIRGYTGDYWSGTPGAFLLIWTSKGTSRGKNWQQEIYAFSASIEGGPTLPPEPAIVPLLQQGIAEGNSTWIRFSVTLPDGRLSV